MGHLQLNWNVSSALWSAVQPVASVCEPVYLSIDHKLILTRNDSIQRKTGKGFWPQIFRIFGFITLLAIILNIVGITGSSNLQDGVKSTETKVAMILYLVSWVGLVGLILMVSTRYTSIESGEHRLLLAIAICTPILVIRLGYSYMTCFGNNPHFNMVTGNETIQLVMVVIEEIIIVYIMLLTGLTLGIKDKVAYKVANSVENGETAYDPYSGNANPEMVQGSGYYSSAPARKPKRPIRGGPIHMLVAYTMNKMDERRENAAR